MNYPSDILFYGVIQNPETKEEESFLALNTSVEGHFVNFFKKKIHFFLKKYSKPDFQAFVFYDQKKASFHTFFDYGNFLIKMILFQV